MNVVSIDRCAGGHNTYCTVQYNMKTCFTACVRGCWRAENPHSAYIALLLHVCHHPLHQLFVLADPLVNADTGMNNWCEFQPDNVVF